jgi:hypothetical protein
MQSPGDSEPLGSSLHWPAAELQLYMTGAGVGVGTGVGFGTGATHEYLMPFGHASHCPFEVWQLAAHAALLA